MLCERLRSSRLLQNSLRKGMLAGLPGKPMPKAVQCTLW